LKAIFKEASWSGLPYKPDLAQKNKTATDSQNLAPIFKKSNAASTDELMIVFEDYLKQDLVYEGYPQEGYTLEGGEMAQFNKEAVDPFVIAQQWEYPVAMMT
jgi:hypothetical protein